MICSSCPATKTTMLISAIFQPKSPYSPPPPPPQPSPPPPFDNNKYNNNNNNNKLAFSRRGVCFFSAIPFISTLQTPAPASAFSFGICTGPKDWLKEQKKKSAKFLLAPVDASRNILRAVYLLLANGSSDYGNKELEEVRNQLRSAARDCVPQDRNSFVSFQASTGVEVCTFRLVVKNAASLLDDKDPLKLAAEADLGDVVRSFTSLSKMTNDANFQLPTDRQKVADALMDTISSLDRFEQGLRNCLEV